MWLYTQSVTSYDIQHDKMKYGNEKTTLRRWDEEDDIENNLIFLFFVIHHLYLYIFKTIKDLNLQAGSVLRFWVRKKIKSGKDKK